MILQLPSPAIQRVLAVREWARADGVAVSARGRLSQRMLRQYQEAQGGTADGDHGVAAEGEPVGGASPPAARST